MKMKHLTALGGSIAILSLIWTTFAPAADVPVKAVGSAVSSPYRWDGAYVGGYIGAQQGKSSTGVDGWTDTQRNPVQKCYSWEEGGEKCYDKRNEFVTSSATYPAASSNGNVIGVMFGGYGGYNKQLNNALVAGIELDGGWSGARDYVSVYAVNSSHKMPWNMALTGRFGVLPTTSLDTLLYLKAGLAVQQQQSSLIGPTGAASASQTKVGWTAGLGVEHKINQRLSARVEGMFTKVSDQTVVIPGASSTLNGGSWKGVAGLSWSFN